MGERWVKHYIKVVHLPFTVLVKHKSFQQTSCSTPRWDVRPPAEQLGVEPGGVLFLKLRVQEHHPDGVRLREVTLLPRMPQTPAAVSLPVEISRRQSAGPLPARCSPVGQVLVTHWRLHADVQPYLSH